MSREPELPHGVRPADHLVVVHDFDARGLDELTLRRGDKIELVELDDGFGDGWYLGKHLGNNNTGLFPGVYTAATPKIKVTNKTVPSDSSINTAHSGEPESSGSSAVNDSVTDATSPGSNEETTPQPSRHASASGTDLGVIPDIPEPDRVPPTSQRRVSNSLNQGISRTISEALNEHKNGEDSPVMNETLSVIDEHITHLSTPRHSVVAQDQKTNNDSASEYSSHLSYRMSYINGHETDEEEDNQLNEETVKNWNPSQTAQYLRGVGVDSKHCDIFEEQEITGDVLLEMDQEFIYMKEFDFGVMGKRLKTWHKVKAFQEEVKGRSRSMSVSSNPRMDGPLDEVERSQSRATFLPRIPSLVEGNSYRKVRGSIASSPSQSQPRQFGRHPSQGASTISHDNASRPSAASIREYNHSRRHSSIDSIAVSPMEAARPGTGMRRGSSHHKNPSFDRGWTMSNVPQPLSSRPGTAVGTPVDSSPQQPKFGRVLTNGSDSAIALAHPVDDLDRGYFSGNEADARKLRTVLKKRDSASRTSGSSQKFGIAEAALKGRHARYGSAESIRDIAPHTSPASKTYHSSSSLKGRFRSASFRQEGSSTSTSYTTHSPMVTNLENPMTFENPTPTSSSPFHFSFSPRFTKYDGDSSGRTTPSSNRQTKTFAPKGRRAVGLRAISDAITGGDKPVAKYSNGDTHTPVSDREVPQSPARTGSSTPSATTSKSQERDSTDGSSKADNVTPMIVPKIPQKSGSKSKKDTSAYMRGLEKKTPREQMKGCDYSGWMKKKSSNLMTTWKPRLFILRGRRLSYYYSEDDTEERGLIDISSHRVLRADGDPITALHATLTGATTSPTAPTNDTGDAAIPPEVPRFKNGPADQPFIFKLVPPRTGLPRAVQFTKPSVHFFQVDNVKEGRLWMAALMKATIERDMNLPVESTNKQRTISLKQALSQNQRPPELMAAPDLPKDDEARQAKTQQMRSMSLDDGPKTNDDDQSASSFEKIDGLQISPESLTSWVNMQS